MHNGNHEWTNHDKEFRPPRDQIVPQTKQNENMKKVWHLFSHILQSLVYFHCLWMFTFACTRTHTRTKTKTAENVLSFCFYFHTEPHTHTAKWEIEGKNWNNRDPFGWPRFVCFNAIARAFRSRIELYVKHNWCWRFFEHLKALKFNAIQHILLIRKLTHTHTHRSIYFIVRSWCGWKWPFLSLLFLCVRVK